MKEKDLKSKCYGNPANGAYNLWFVEDIKNELKEKTYQLGEHIINGLKARGVGKITLLDGKRALFEVTLKDDQELIMSDNIFSVYGIYFKKLIVKKTCTEILLQGPNLLFQTS